MPYDIGSLQHDLFELYGEKKYAEALNLLRRQFGTFPEHRDMLMYFRACLESVTGEGERALTTLEEIVSGGGCVPGGLLEQESDLASVWASDKFRDISRRNEILRKQRMESLASELTMPTILRDDSEYAILYLHGSHRAGEREKQIFLQMASIRENMYFPNGPERYFHKDEYIWNDEVTAYEYILDIIARHTGDKKVVLAGFSRGARAALKIVYERKFIVSGVIAYAPANLNDINEWTFLYDTIKVPAAVMVGADDDLAYEKSLRLCDMMRKGNIPVRSTIIENTAHTYPENYERFFTEALNWISKRA